MGGKNPFAIICILIYIICRRLKIIRSLTSWFVLFPLVSIVRSNREMTEVYLKSSSLGLGDEILVFGV